MEENNKNIPFAGGYANVKKLILNMLLMLIQLYLSVVKLFSGTLHWNNSRRSCRYHRRCRRHAAPFRASPVRVTYAVVAAAAVVAAQSADVDVDAYAPANANRHSWKSGVANAAQSTPNRSCRYRVL